MGKSPKKPVIQDKKPEVKRIHTPVSISFKRIEAGEKYCLSVCTQNELKDIADSLRQLTSMSWQDVLSTAGKGKNKAGLGYTTYSDDALKESWPNWLSNDTKVSAVRASSCVRVFGVYIDHIYYLIWFDRNHDIVDG